MTAWQKLLACSQLLAGTAWQLISNPKTGGAGVVMNDGISVEVASMEIDVEVQAEIEVELQLNPVEVEVSTAPIEVEICE